MLPASLDTPGNSCSAQGLSEVTFLLTIITREEQRWPGQRTPRGKSPLKVPVP